MAAINIGIIILIILILIILVIAIATFRNLYKLFEYIIKMNDRLSEIENKTNNYLDFAERVINTNVALNDLNKKILDLKLQKKEINGNN